MTEGWTRGEFVRRAASSGAGALLLGGAAGTGRLVESALGATPAPLDTHLFRSRPDLVPPILTTVHHDPRTSAGYLFLAPLSGPGQRGSLILDRSGEPVWFKPSKPVVALNFRAAVYRNKPVLTWWEGKTEHGLGEGTHIIVDETYRELVRVPAGGGRPSDLHEFLLTSRGTALVTAWERVPMDLSALGGLRNGAVVGGIVQELELPSGRVLFEWRSLDHVAIDESHAEITTKGAYDYFHINSIELDADGNFLISARNTWGIYKIDRGSGEVIWRLGGKRSDFTMGPGTGFAWQHDARHHGARDQLISLFDDGAAPPVQPQSKALVLALDTKRMRATLHKKYTHSPPVLSHALGSTQVLPNGNVLVGWGTAPWLSEYTHEGELVFDARLPKGGQNYRALKMPWRGHPTELPAIATRRREGQRFVYASWNGATEVHSWRLETGASASSLPDTAAMRRTGFETELLAPADARYAAVVALDADGKPLGRSKAEKIT
jgi:hypothetical protein